MDILGKACGCLLGAAFGDSMGACVEFMHRDLITILHPKGLTEPLGYMDRGKGSVTDDTQQALYVCRGMVTGLRHGGSDEEMLRGVWDQLKIWRLRQDDEPNFRRSPGQTSMTALLCSSSGSIELPINESKSCGAVMRAHPVGVVYAGEPEKAYRLGSKIGALTHGHKDGYAAAGATSAIVAGIMSGQSMREAASAALSIMEDATPDAKGAIRWLRLALLCDVTSTLPDLSCGALGWEGDEALAIGLVSALKYPNDLVKACSFASCHDGDSDSTAAIAGAFIGAACGDVAVPEEWQTKLEHAAELVQRAMELLKPTLKRMYG